MAKNLFRNLKRDYTLLGDLTEHSFDLYIRHKVKFDLEQLDNDYQVKFPFEVNKDKTKGSLSYEVQIPELATFKRENVYGEEEVRVADLFNWLDKGIRVSHARFVTDPKTGEKKVVVSKKKFNYINPYEPKGWTTMLLLKHEARLPVVALAAIRKFLGKK